MLNSEFIAPLSSSFWIIPREGSEALLVITMICSALKESKRESEIPFVYKNCIAALGLGLILAIFCVFLHASVLGQAREMTEGLASVFALMMLLYVNFSAFQGLKSLTNLSLFSIGFLSFISVFRELVETILFYFSLFSGNKVQQLGTLAGLLLGIVLLLLLVYAYLRATTHWKLLNRFMFNITPFFIFLLSIMCLGNAINAFQEAGILSFNNISWMFNNDYFHIQSSEEYLITIITFLSCTGIFFIKQFYKSIVLGIKFIMPTKQTQVIAS
jgi:high-affinity iron transporter